MPNPPRIYLDNAATSWPKPEAVYRAVDHYQRKVGVAAGRGAYAMAGEVGRQVARCRQQLAELIDFPDPAGVVFAFNGTDALNLAFHGLLSTGDRVVTTAAEHNSVLRPLRELEQRGVISLEVVPCDGSGRVDPAAIAQALTVPTKLVALVHASNVTGALQPVADVLPLTRAAGALLLLDAAQTLGQHPFSWKQVPADLIAAPGHKSLLGPLGTGVLYVAESAAERLQPWRCGGTGSASESERQPAPLPDRLEAGNHNVPGIVGLSAGLAYLAETGIAGIAARERALCEQLRGGVAELPGVTLHGPADPAERIGVVSLEVDDFAPQEVAMMLDAAAGIQIRSGFHCAPRIHQAIGSFLRGGTIRFSVGPFTTADQIHTAIETLTQLTQGTGTR